MLFPFSRFTIHGSSMLPTLKPGQDVLVFNWAYLFFKPKAGDLVILTIKGKEIIKRIQSCYGNNIYVIGDNKEESTDSRSFGPVDASAVIGKVVVVVR